MMFFKRKKVVKEMGMGSVVRFKDPKRKMVVRRVKDDEHVEVSWIEKDVGRPR